MKVRVFFLGSWVLAVTLGGCGDGSESVSESDSISNSEYSSLATEESGNSEESDSSISESTNVTDEYIVDGEDTRRSPYGKVRSTIPDEIILCRVEYENISSGGYGEYYLEVDFVDGEPERINFPNGGWRHVWPTEVGDTWECTDEDVTYTVHKPE